MKQVTFLPKQAAKAIKVPSNVISISSPNEWAEFSCDHKRLLRLSFYPNDFGDLTANVATEETANQIIDFVESCEGEDIVVHCGEGRIRSVAVADFIRWDMDYEIDLNYPGCPKQMGGASSNLYRLLRRTYRARYPREKVQTTTENLVNVIDSEK